MAAVLKGLKVVEMAGLAPSPFAGMILADFGASVVRVDKPSQLAMLTDVLARNKRSICINLKDPFGVKIVKNLTDQSDVLIEPYRPGVMEKLGLGPDTLCSTNPRLIYVRLTGFGQSGPLSSRAGHDINYLAISGVLSRLGGAESNPTPPINLLADFAGGSLMCVNGILLALLERIKSGRGQIVDTSMCSSVAYISTFITAAKRNGLFRNPKGTDLLDGGAHFYCTYKTSDDQYMSVGAIEPQFYKDLLKGLGLDQSLSEEQFDTSKWPGMKKKMADIFATKTRQEWTDIFTGLEGCVEPVLSLNEAPLHPHNKDNYLYDDITHEYYPKPCPSLKRTPGEIMTFEQPEVGQYTSEILKELNYTDEEISDLIDRGIVIQSDDIRKKSNL